MVSLSLIMEDVDNTIKTSIKSSRPLPEDIKDCTPAEVLLTEIYQLLENHYQLDKAGLIKIT